MFNPDTRKFENLMNSSIASQTAAIAAIAAANSFNAAASLNVAQMHNDIKPEWYHDWNHFNPFFDTIMPTTPLQLSNDENFIGISWDSDDDDDEADNKLIHQHLHR